MAYSWWLCEIQWILAHWLTDNISAHQARRRKRRYGNRACIQWTLSEIYKYFIHKTKVIQERIVLHTNAYCLKIRKNKTCSYCRDGPTTYKLHSWQYWWPQDLVIRVATHLSNIKYYIPKFLEIKTFTRKMKSFLFWCSQTPKAKFSSPIYIFISCRCTEKLCGLQWLQHLLITCQTNDLFSVSTTFINK